MMFNTYQYPSVLPRRVANGIQGWNYANDQKKAPATKSEARRFVGQVKWYCSIRGFGYIARSNNGGDIQVREADLKETNLNLLINGQQVTFEIQKSGRRQGRQERAVNIKLEG